MSFGFNGPSFKPTIQEAQSMKNNGGGGNLGYFQRGKKKKEEENKSVFEDDLNEDCFLSENIEMETEPEPDNSGLLDKIAKKIADWKKSSK